MQTQVLLVYIDVDPEYGKTVVLLWICSCSLELNLACKI